MFLCRVILSAVSLSFNSLFLSSTAVLADDLDLKKAQLHCWINRSEALYIFHSWTNTESNRVVYAPFMQTTEALKLDYFFVDRGTNIFQFSGNTAAHRYEGNTRRSFHDPRDPLAVSLFLRIDGVDQPEIPCAE